MVAVPAHNVVGQEREQSIPIEDQYVCGGSLRSREVLVAELEKRNISYRSDSNCVAVVASAAEFDAALHSAWDVRPPSGRSMRRQGPDGTDANAEILSKLETAGVDADTMVYDGNEYVVWAEDDAARAEAALGIDAERREVMRRMREAQPSLTE
jgi:hypothetical protein